jgi:hypothetical protein
MKEAAKRISKDKSESKLLIVVRDFNEDDHDEEKGR